MINQTVLMVNPTDGGKGWAVRTGAGHQLTVHRLKQDAVNDAEQQLQSITTGGELRIFRRDGQLQQLRQIAPVAARPMHAVQPQPQPDGLVEQIEHEGERWNHVITSVALLLPIAGASGAAWMSPEVAAADDWIGVFFATLAWSLGCALSVYLVVKHSVKGWAAVLAVTGCFAASLIIANLVGTGVLNTNHVLVEASQSDLPDALGFIAGVATTAFATFGIVGTALGGGIGVWLGWRYAKHAPADT